MINSTKNAIDIAAGRIKADLVLKNCKIINVFSHEIIADNIAISNGEIIGFGSYEGEKELDLQGNYVCPGLIDAHIHIESGMVSPKEFARAIVPRGTTTIIADPHEIANVCGLEGIKYILNETENIPLNTFIMLPACVPATSFENSGAVLDADKLKTFIEHPRVLGLGELMDYPAVINAEENIIKKIDLIKSHNKIIDGHGPEISGKELNAYTLSSVKTEHECSSVEEMLERIRCGMYIAMRQGSAAKDLEVLIKGITPENMKRCMLCTDDRHPEDILNEGHIDNSLKIAIKNGLDPISAIKMATLNAAECYGLKNLGAIAPGYKADLIVLDNLEEFNIVKVFKDGVLTAENKNLLFNIKSSCPDAVTNTVNINPIENNALEIKFKSNKANIISLLPNSLVTKKVQREISVDNNGLFKYDPTADILKIAVVERHNATGNIGMGLVENFGLKNGALASTIAHDSHNIVVIGDNDEDMIAAIKELNRVGGGITVCSNRNIIETLELPIAGLMSNLTMEEVSCKLCSMLKICYEDLKINKNVQPFMTLAFLSLPVIPEIKITDKGLFDVTNFTFLNIDAES